MTLCHFTLQVARRHAQAYCQQTLGYKGSNMRFVEGHIELLDEAGIKDESVDILISNCVINLSPDKARGSQGSLPGAGAWRRDVLQRCVL